jgi:hypothetical protein
MFHGGKFSYPNSASYGEAYHRITQMNQVFLAICAALMALALRIESRR